jgi:hypothetical protein
MQSGLKLPPQAARTEGPPKIAAAPMEQSREAHRSARPLHFIVEAPPVQQRTRLDRCARPTVTSKMSHSHLTHLGGQNLSAPLLMAISGHKRQATLPGYVKPSQSRRRRADGRHPPRPARWLTCPVPSTLAGGIGDKRIVPRGCSGVTSGAHNPWHNLETTCFSGKPAGQERAARDSNPQPPDP